MCLLGGHLHVQKMGIFLVGPLSWPLHLLSWPLHLVLEVLSFYQPAQVLHLHTWWSLAANCAGGVFRQPLVQTLLAPEVVLPFAACTGGLFLLPTGANTPLALEQLALCGGVFYAILLIYSLLNPIMLPDSCIQNLFMNWHDSGILYHALCTYVCIVYIRMHCVHTYICIVYIRMHCVHTYALCTYVYMHCVHTYALCTYVCIVYIHMHYVHTYRLKVHGTLCIYTPC